MTRCIPNADKVAEEIRHIAKGTGGRHLQKDADFITGMLFVMEESKLTDVTELREKIVISARSGDMETFIHAANKAADKIGATACDRFEYREI